MKTIISVKDISESLAEAKRCLLSKEETHVELSFAAGVYPVKETLTLSSRDVGNEKSSLTLRGDADGESLITGLMTLPAGAFERVEGKPYYVARLDESTKVDGRFPRFRDLYVNGCRVPLCRTPGESRFVYGPSKTDDKENPKLYVDPTLVKGMSTDVLPLTELWMKVEWQIHCVHIVGIDESDILDGCVAVKVKEDDWKVFLPGHCMHLKDRPYWLSNNLAFMTGENCFYYDERNGLIYCCPPKGVDLTAAEVAYPLVERIFAAKNVKNLRFERLSFTGTTSNYVTDDGFIAGQCGRIKRNDVGFLTDAACFIEGSENTAFDGCTFRALGADAISFRTRTVGVTVRNCRFYDIGSGAIRVGFCDGLWNEETNKNEDIFIENNEINGAGTTFCCSVAIFLSNGKHVRIRHNTVRNSVYSAVSVGWSWANVKDWTFGERVHLVDVEIAYNDLENYLCGMRDGGGIYTLGGNAEPEYPYYLNTIHDNYLYATDDIAQGYPNYCHIYHDQGSSHWHDYRNVIYTEASVLPICSFHGTGSYRNRLEEIYLVGADESEKPILGGCCGPLNIAIESAGLHPGIAPDALPYTARVIVRDSGCDFCTPVYPGENK